MSTPTKPPLQQPPPSLPQGGPNPIYSLTSSEFDPVLALANPHLVNVPLKSVKGLQSLNEVTHLLPRDDIHFKPQNTIQAGSSKHRMDILLTSLTTTSNHDNANRSGHSNKNTQNSSTQPVKSNLQITNLATTALIHQTVIPPSAQASQRFTTKVKVSKMPLMKYPLLAFKPGTTRFYNTIIRRQFFSIVQRWERRFGSHQLSQQQHFHQQPNQHQQQQHQPTQAHSLSQHLINTIASFGKYGCIWIEYFLLPHDALDNSSSSNPNSNVSATTESPQPVQPNTNQSTQSVTNHKPYTHPQHSLPPPQSPQTPLIFNGIVLKYPYLTPKQIIFMLFQTHFLRKCKVHQTKRKRLAYPCTCLIQPSPLPLPIINTKKPVKKVKNMVGAVNDDKTASNHNSSTSTNTQNNQNNTMNHLGQLTKPVTPHPGLIKAQFKHKFFTMGPLHSLEGMLYQNSSNNVRINIVGTLPAIPKVINLQFFGSTTQGEQGQQQTTNMANDQYTSNTGTYTPCIASSQQLLSLSQSLPPIPTDIATILTQDLFNCDDNDGVSVENHVTENNNTKLYYNRSGNPIISEYANNRTNTSNDKTTQSTRSTSPCTLLQGRMRKGIASILIGKLIFFDRKGNVGLNDAIEYKWIWIPIKQLGSTQDTAMNDKTDHIDDTHSNSRNQSSQYQQHGVWAIVSRQLPRTIVMAQTIATVGTEKT